VVKVCTERVLWSRCVLRECCDHINTGRLLLFYYILRDYCGPNKYRETVSERIQRECSGPNICRKSAVVIMSAMYASRHFLVPACKTSRCKTWFVTDLNSLSLGLSCCLVSKENKFCVDKEMCTNWDS
jgi:hypothetical protein